MRGYVMQARTRARWFTCGLLPLLAGAAGAQNGPPVGAPLNVRPVPRTVSLSGGQVPWTVALVPGSVPIPVGTCMAVRLDLMNNASHDWPRTPNGTRISLADFDLSVSAPDPRAGVGRWSGPTNWSACACQAGRPGTVVTVTAIYPAAALPASQRVPGVAFRSWIEVPLSMKQGGSEPPGCDNIPQTTTVAMTPPPAIPPPSAATQPASTTTPPPPPPPPPPPAYTPPPPPPPAQPVAAAAPLPVNPTGFTAVETGPNQVQLSWQPVSGVSYYALFGPGIPGGGARINGATTFTAMAVPSGAQEWAVASYYEPGPVSTAAAAFPRVSLNVHAPAVAVAAPPPASQPPAAPASGNYLVTVTALRVYQASRDDQLSRDGMGDEVYAAAYVRRYDRRTGAIAESNSRKTTAYGDVNFFGATRIQAGRMSATGGLVDGDQVPDGPRVATRSMPPQDVMFPFRLWQGTLTDGQDALVINPTVWEQDGNNGLYLQWVQQQQMLNLSIFSRQSVQDEIAQNIFGVLATGASGVNGSSALNFGARTAADIALLGFGIPIVNLLQVSSDRPIGMVNNASAPDQTMLLNHTIVLTREIIEAALAQPARGLIPAPPGFSSAGFATGPTGAMAAIGMIASKPGILVVHLQDGPMPGAFTPERPAIYEMFIQVERIP